MSKFSMRDFVMSGLLSGVGKLADYQIFQQATSWYNKGVLTQDDN